jgi:glycerophosphoryl diester phosphodiesterase
MQCQVLTYYFYVWKGKASRMTAFWHKIGHRGTPREFPGNTMRGFQRAVERGCTMVECDVRQAADGVIVLAHDPYVTDTSGTRVVIADTASDVLHSLDLGSGEGVPRLDELALWARGKCSVMADMKCEGNGVEEGVLAALQALDPAARVIPGASAHSRARFRELDPALPLSLTLSDQDIHLVEDGSLNILLTDLDTCAVTWHHALITAERVARLHQYDKKVYVWTVDDLPTMRNLLEMGVDGIISNRADLLQPL